MPEQLHGAEHDELPAPVLKEVQAFADVNVAWLSRQLAAAGLGDANSVGARARAIYGAVAGAQILARSRSDVAIFDALIESYRQAGPLPN